MKHALLILFFFIACLAQAQPVLTVTPSDAIVCPRDSAVFVAGYDTTFHGTMTYQWYRNGLKINGAIDSLYRILHVTRADTGFYHCVGIFIAPGINDTLSSNLAHLRMYPEIRLDTLYRYNALGCFIECKGQFFARVDRHSGTPWPVSPYYIYNWHAGKAPDDTIVLGLCPSLRPYHLTITDSVGCTFDTTYLVDYLKSPKVTFTMLPKDTVYLTNPNIQVAFPDSMKQYISNWKWDFGDNIKVPNENPLNHTYSNSGKYKVMLSFTDINGCDTTITDTITVKVAELKIPNVFTPNGDGINDDFSIEINGSGKEVDYREAYKSNELVVMDRWGRKVFSASNYKSGDWAGENLSDGTYFYVLKCIGEWGNDVFRGSVAILRSAP